MRNILLPRLSRKNSVKLSFLQNTVWKSDVKRDQGKNQPFSNFLSKNVDLTEK